MGKTFDVISEFKQQNTIRLGGNKRYNFSIPVLFICICFSALIACTLNRETSPVYGTYRIYRDDPMAKMFFGEEDTYIRLGTDHSIVYHNTINGKPKFNFQGEFTLNEETNTIEIKWKEGKLPNKLTIEKRGEDYLINIGRTTYRKEVKSSS